MRFYLFFLALLSAPLSAQQYDPYAIDLTFQDWISQYNNDSVAAGTTNADATGILMISLNNSSNYFMRIDMIGSCRLEGAGQNITIYIDGRYVSNYSSQCITIAGGTGLSGLVISPNPKVIERMIKGRYFEVKMYGVNNQLFQMRASLLGFTKAISRMLEMKGIVSSKQLPTGQF